MTICHQLRLKAADGKMRLTDVADTDPVFCPRVFWRENRKKQGFVCPVFPCSSFYQNRIGPCPIQLVAPRAVSIADAIEAMSCTIHFSVSFLVAVIIIEH